MLDLITLAQRDITATIDGKKKKFSLFTMNDWGELLRRLKKRKQMELADAVAAIPVPQEVLMLMISDAADKIYEVKDGLIYSKTIDGVIDVLHISSRDEDRKLFENLQSEGDIDQINYLVWQILAVALADETDEADQDVKKKPLVK